MKTTLDIPDDLMRAAKVRAAQDNVTLKQLVSDALREALSRASDQAAVLDPVGLLKNRLVYRQDGSVYNPSGIEDAAFFEALEDIRSASRAQPLRDPFEDR